MMHFGSFAQHIEALSHLSYGGIYVALLASGHVVPVPESVTLILLGYLSTLGRLSVWGIFSVGIASVMTFDIVLYLISLGGSELATHFSNKVKTSLVDRYRGAEEKHLFGMVFISHFVPGWRFANPIICGITQMPWKKFALYSFISSAVYAPMFVLVGYIFSARIGRVIIAIESIRHLFLILLIIAMGTAIIVYNIHRHAEK